MIKFKVFIIIIFLNIQIFSLENDETIQEQIEAACFEHGLQKIKDLANQNNLFEIRFYNNHTILMRAVCNGAVDIFIYLLQKCDNIETELNKINSKNQNVYEIIKNNCGFSSTHVFDDGRDEDIKAKFNSAIEQEKARRRQKQGRYAYCSCLIL